MTPSTACVAFIAQHERFRPTAYLPTKHDRWTLGYGHTKGVKEGDTCTFEQAKAWLREDMAEAAGAVNKLVTVPLTQNQFDALVSFTFNVGGDIDADTIAEGLGDSTLLSKLNRGDYVGAAAEFAKWNKQKGRVLNGLTTRRAAEREMFEG
jgi:lysozyme